MTDLHLSNRENINIQNSLVYNITEFRVVQQNRVQVNHVQYDNLDVGEERMRNGITLEIELRTTHYMELKAKDTVTEKYQGHFDDHFVSNIVRIIVRDEERPLTGLHLKIHTDTRDVYAGEV
ncbi:hypothetical protein FGIG_06709 [Fasciola gigantica]|uniref:Uncharacterized protein n=1 Tax=Fasciola gigantica TaxID=46835 RepID=A0A504Z127_FASGI|nr:hypothetical protein FGIG_06709 [Fasciola gigantica]